MKTQTMNYINLTPKNFQTEEQLKSLLNPITDPDVIAAFGNTYDKEELCGYFIVQNNENRHLSVWYKPNSDKPWTVDGVIANNKRYKSFTHVKKHLAKCM